MSVADVYDYSVFDSVCFTVAPFGITLFTVKLHRSSFNYRFVNLRQYSAHVTRGEKKAAIKLTAPTSPSSILKMAAIAFVSQG